MAGRRYALLAKCAFKIEDLQFIKVIFKQKTKKPLFGVNEERDPVCEIVTELENKYGVIPFFLKALVSRVFRAYLIICSVSIVDLCWLVLV